MYDKVLNAPLLATANFYGNRNIYAADFKYICSSAHSNLDIYANLKLFNIFSLGTYNVWTS